MDMKNSDGSRQIFTDPGSFRDPSGRVVYYNGEVYRSVDDEGMKLFRDMEQKGSLNLLAEKGYIVGTEIIDDNDPVCSILKEQVPGSKHFLHHDRIPLITYPYEWSFSMLAECAKLQIRLQLELINKGYSLKDATAFNLQFSGCRPVFIDIPSIERLEVRDVWIAYGQFCQMFLFPLLLKYYKHIGMKNIFLAGINGISVEEVYSIFGFPGSLRPALFFDVFLQYLSQKKAEGKQTALKQRIKSPGRSTAPQVVNLNRLLRKIDRMLKKNNHSSHWKDYADTNTYSDRAEEEKKDFVEKFLLNRRPETVLDLGCNTGIYSVIAAKHGSRVTAVDFDHDSIDLLYNRAREEDLNILPLWIDITNPSPGLGFCLRERKSFMERFSGDAVFALALIHHLLITCRIPLELIRDFFYTLTGSHLVVEFIGRKDVMFQHLLALREDIYQDITRENFLKIFLEKFDLEKEERVPESERILFVFRKRSI